MKVHDTCLGVLVRYRAVCSHYRIAQLTHVVMYTYTWINTVARLNPVSTWPHALYFGSVRNHCNWDETLMLDHRPEPMMKEALYPSWKPLQPNWKSGSHELLNNSDKVNRKGGEILTDLNFQYPNYSALCAIKKSEFFDFHPDGNWSIQSNCQQNFNWANMQRNSDIKTTLDFEPNTILHTITPLIFRLWHCCSSPSVASAMLVSATHSIVYRSI